MLVKLKNRHLKRIFWVLLCIIIPAFILWGGKIRQKKQITGQIGKHRIDIQEFNNYLKLARVHSFLVYGPDYPSKITPQEQKSQAWRLYLLDWKAEKEKISVNDREIVKFINERFSLENEFDKDRYTKLIQYYLQMNPRDFEERIRKILRAEKLWKKYIKIEIKEEEILDSYKKDHEKAKISFIYIPYDKFEQELGIKDSELKNFYESNKGGFQEEPKVKIKYLFIPQEEYAGRKTEINQKIKEGKTIEGISENIKLSCEETDFLTPATPIKGIGWAPALIKSAFSLPENSLSELLEINNGFIIFEKTASKRSFIPSFEEVKEKVIEKVKIKKEKDLAKNLGDNIIKEIKAKEIRDIEIIATNYKLENKETAYFKYHDYVEGVGLNNDLNQAVFESRKGEIILKNFLLPKGNYIIQVKDLIPIDEEKFKQDKQEYKRKILFQREFMERIKFLAELQKEANLKIYSTLQQQLR